MIGQRRLVAFGLLLLVSMASMAQSQGPLRRILNLNNCANGQCSQGQQVQQVQQPFQGVVVGQVFHDGSVVTSVGPFPDQVPAMAPLLPQSASGVIAGRRDFRQVFLDAATQALRDKEINRFQHGRLIISSLRPRELANIQAWVHQNAIQEGLATAASPDWEAIIAFIKELIPLIVQLIDLFSQVQPHLEAQYVLRNPSMDLQTVCDWSYLAV